MSILVYFQVFHAWSNSKFFAKKALWEKSIKYLLHFGTWDSTFGWLDIRKADYKREIDVVSVR